MGARTGIEWTDSTWSPVKGCTRVSPGCTNCYAETLAGRFCGPGLPLEGFAARTPSGPRWTGRVELAADRLDVPVRWTKPRRIFVNSQSDTFHEKLTNDEIAAVFGAMAAAPQHTFQVLTKRSSRLPEWFAWAQEDLLGRYEVPALIGHAAALASSRGFENVADRLHRAANDLAGVRGFPLGNVHIGVSVESAEQEHRIVDLLRTPAAKRFLSFEPLLGPLHYLGNWLRLHGGGTAGPWHDALGRRRGGAGVGGQTLSSHPSGDISWIIVGGESGPNARPMHPDWAREIRDICEESRVPFFFKQWGEWVPVEDSPAMRDPVPLSKTRPELRRLLPSGEWSRSLGEEAACMEKLGKKLAGAMLDGREWKELPS